MSNELDEVERRALDVWTPMVPPSDFADKVLAARAGAPIGSRGARWVMITGIVLALAAGVALVLIGLRTNAAGGNHLAELTRADGPVDRMADAGPWNAIDVGTKLYLGDAVRTAEGSADLVIAGRARLAMQPHSLIRFGGDAGASRISVELGSIDLTGTGTYALDVGDIKLQEASIRISARNGTTAIELLVGDATVVSAGETIALASGKPIEVGLAVAVLTIDAGVEPPVLDAALPPVVAGGDPSITVTGKKAEVQLPGETTWSPIAAGDSALVPGARVRVGAGSTATLTAGGATLELAGGARALLGEDRRFVIEAGLSKVSATAAAQVRLPGGELALDGSPTTPAEARLDANARDTRVTMLRATGKLTGSGGGELVMNRGESATLAKTGTIRVIEAIPSYFDLRTQVGQTFVIHDPRGATAVQFQFGGKCARGGIVEVDRDSRFRTAKISGGTDAANVMVGAGSWAYRLRCSTDAGEGPAVASGRIAVVRDSGNRALPKQQATNTIDADGRNYTISYQSTIPNLVVRVKGTGSRFVLHMATGGVEQTFESTQPKFTIPGKALAEGVYTYWVDRDGVRDPSVSTLRFQFDNAAPQVYIETPATNASWGDSIEIRGAVLPGWTVSIDGVTVPMDSQRRFVAKVPRPAAGALGITLAHPQRGTHVYIRRGSK